MLANPATINSSNVFLHTYSNLKRRSGSLTVLHMHRTNTFFYLY